MADDLIQSLSDAIEQFEGRKPGDRSRRNHNPGNLRSGPGQSGTDSEGFAIFPDDQTGRAALENQVRLNIGRGLNLNEFFGGKEGVYEGYAPSKDANDPARYAQFVAGKIGKSPTDVLGGKQVADQTLERTLPDGRKLQFPAGTSKEEQDQYIQQYYPTPGQRPAQQRMAVQAPAWTQEGQYDTGLLGAINPITGAKKIVRGAYEFPSDWRAGASDILEGAGTEAGDIATALSLASGVPEVLGGAGLLEAYGPRLLGLGKAALGGAVGSNVGGGVTSMFSDDPRNIRLAQDVGGWGGALFGPRAMEAGMRNPYARAAGGAYLAHRMGAGPAVDLGAAILSGRPDLLTGRAGRLFRAFGGGGDEGPPSITPREPPSGGGGRQAGPVRPPNVPSSFMEHLNTGIANGTLSPQDYMSELTRYGVSEPVARSMMQTALLRADRPITLQPTGEAGDIRMQGQTPGGAPPGTPVTLPGTVQPVPQQQGLNLQQQPMLRQPQVQPPGQQNPQQLNIPFNGAPPEQMPLPGTQLPQPSQQPQIQVPPLQQQLQLPVQRPGAPAQQMPLNFGRPDIPQQELPFTPERATGNAARLIADAAQRLNRNIPVTRLKTYIARQGAAKRLGLNFVPEETDFIEANRILRGRARSTRPTANVP